VEYRFDQFDYIGAAEFAEMSARYLPLAAAVRELMDASLGTDADADTARAATAAVRSVTEILRGTRRGRPERQLLHEDTGRAVAWFNPVTGPRNPLAPPLGIRRDPDGRCRSEFTLGEVYEGPPGLVHGGVCALILDQLLGEVATAGMTKPRFTGSLTVRFLRGTPLGPLRAEAFTDREQDHKTYVRGFIGDAEGPTAEAEGVFIMPAWARGAQ
jgi:acyl-coenzyme A thioesterase PaaI-like protein